jgi:hypothetical protein
VELVYAPDCPHVAAARAELLRAFANAGTAPRWREWRTDDPEAPSYARTAASPAVFVGGRDVLGSAPGAAASCRLAGAPGAASIARALARAAAPRRTWRRTLAVLPAVGVALLPKVACPACWPAYAGALGSLGLGFLLESAWLFPLTALFLAVALLALAWRACSRRGYGPLAAGLVAATVVLTAKFALDSDAGMYAGLALLVGASLWNSWPRKAQAACPACNDDGG